MAMTAAHTVFRSALFVVTMAAGLWLAPTGNAVAQDVGSRDWEFYATLYGWAPGLDIETRSQGPVPATDLTIGIGEVIENLDLAVQGAFEVHRGRIIGLVDVNYFSLSDDESLGGILIDSASIETSGIITSANLGYRIVDSQPVVFDVFAGVQITAMETSVDLDGVITTSRSQSETLIDPLLSARSFVDIGSGFFLGATGSIGGFGVDSDLTWQLIGQVGWQANDWLTLRAGYRHQEFIFDDSHPVDRMSLSGPILGATFRL